MTPTNRLRWLNKFSYGGGYTPVLQQWWAEYDAFGAQITGEWRDVEDVDE